MKVRDYITAVAVAAGCVFGSVAVAQASTAHDGQREFCQAYVADYFSPTWRGLLAASHDARGADLRTARAFGAWRSALISGAASWTVQADAERVFTACRIRMPS
jgi:hypothetical protein